MRKSFLFTLLLAPALLLAQTAPNTSAPATPKAPESNNPKAIFHTTAGDITCTLFKDKTPVTVENFIGLATGKKPWTNPVTRLLKANTPMYDGTIFHRVIPDFMIQGGDPAGNGSGDIGFTIPDEFRTDLLYDRPGRLGMANTAQPHTGAGQFFITVVPTPWLNGRNTIFGQCEPLAVTDKIANQPRDPATNRPFNPIRITHVEIVQPGAHAAAAKKAAPATHHPAKKK